MVFLKSIVYHFSISPVLQIAVTWCVWCDFAVTWGKLQRSINTSHYHFSCWRQHMGQTSKDKLRVSAGCSYGGELFLWKTIAFELSAGRARLDLAPCLWRMYKMDMLKGKLGEHSWIRATALVKGILKENMTSPVMWQKPELPKENPQKHSENMQTSHWATTMSHWDSPRLRNGLTLRNKQLIVSPNPLKKLLNHRNISGQVLNHLSRAFNVDVRG